MEINYRRSWELFSATRGVVAMDYVAGQQLLSSRWHQDDPYNRQVPAPPPGDDCTSSHCLVGCAATASSQIMHYWTWPPYGVGSPYNDAYDWPNMMDSVTTSLPAAQQAAVAELCHEVGVAANMDYCGGGGCQSGAPLLDCMGAFTNNFRYSTLASREERRFYPDTVAWFNAIRTQLDANRPVLYEIPNHAIVLDGWQEISGPPTVQQVHVVYGHGGSNDNWYTLDYDIPGTDPNWQYEKIIINIVPAQALGISLSGTYPAEGFPYRYFDQDATGNSAFFEAGQMLQFLPGIKVTCMSTTGNSIDFEGSSSANTRLFTRGDTSIGIRISNGALKLSRYGSIRFN